MKRDSVIDILKGIGIILVVIGHSGCPAIMNVYILSSMLMPLFFISSGFFFNETCIDNKMEYVNRKIKGIYIPYLKWSIIFLLLHNFFFMLGILNSSYGNSFGVVSHMYSPKEMLFRLFYITFSMGRYEGFLLGGYWFLRSLFVGSLLLFICTWLTDMILKSRRKSIAFVSILFCLIGGIMAYFNIQIPFIPQGGYREVMAVFFIGCGYFLARAKKNILGKGAIALASLGIYIAFVSYHPTHMGTRAGFDDWFVLPFSGVTGFVVVYYVCFKLSAKNGFMSNFLKYVGTKSFYILTFHLLMFKPVALLEAYVYNLDWRVIGCHPVVLPARRDCWFWIIYTIISICLSLLAVWIIEMIDNRRKRITIQS